MAKFDRPHHNLIHTVLNDSGFRNSCFSALQVHDRRHIIDGLDRLAGDLGLPITRRSIGEAGPEDEVLMDVPPL